MRSIGVGTCSAMARLGAMVTPYIAQVYILLLTFVNIHILNCYYYIVKVLLKSSFTTSIIIYISAALLAAIASSLLPIETKGRDMKESVEKD